MKIDNLKKTALFFIPFLILPVLLHSCKDPKPEPVELDYYVQHYEPLDEIIFNPERGHYTHRGTANQNAAPISVSALETVRNFHKVSLVLTIYYLGEFMEGAISDQMMGIIEQNMTNLRETGLKCIVRFAYKSNVNDEPWDPSPDIVLQHIEQLTPVLQQNSDVIALAEAGFIGVWGEWYYTSSFGYPEADWPLRKQVIDAWMEALPQNRMIMVRTPKYKTNLFNITLADYLNETEAYSGIPKARIGHHNDCFLASHNDYGTYSNIYAEKDYLEMDTRFVCMGGETCNPSVYCECDNALTETARFHWSYLNKDYHTGVLNIWEDGNCYQDIIMRLGYRFLLDSTTVNKNLSPGSAITLRIAMKNDGYAAPFNPREAELILEHADGNTYVLPIQHDPRFWLPGEINLSIEAGLPIDAPLGDYTVYLHLPDPEPLLRGNPFYSIRCSNTGIWDEDRGYNKLIGFTLTNNEESVMYNGDNLFTLIPR
ncbi:MAG: DUF4832 domain-containing protein [Bacteroidales bacterium]